MSVFNSVFNYGESQSVFDEVFAVGEGTIFSQSYQNKIDQITVLKPNGTTQGREIIQGSNPTIISDVRVNPDPWNTQT